MADKISNNRCLAYQVPHSNGDACGRSFEDAFMLANPDVFGITGATPQDREDQTWRGAKSINKTDFALKYGIETTDWDVPRYILDGLRWLVQKPENISAISTKEDDVVIEDEQSKAEEIV